MSEVSEMDHSVLCYNKCYVDDANNLVLHLRIMPKRFIK